MVLLVFFTRGVSLKSWFEKGIFDREKLIYEDYLKKDYLKKVFWITYGSSDYYLSIKLKKTNKLHKSIILVQMPEIFSNIKYGSHVYSLLLPFLYPKIFSEVDVFKTNQMDGSWSAVIAKFIYKKPLLLRTGYGISELLCNKNPKSIKCKLFKIAENISYKYADKCIVSSNHNFDYIKNINYKWASKIAVIYNYIDLSLFKYEINTRYVNRFIYVGRLNEEKNLFNLIEAFSFTEFVLDIYGAGEMLTELKSFAIDVGANINFCGVVSNKDLSKIYTKYSYFVIPSYSEGMPKTLLEAMASGCLCVGTDVVGINEIIEDNINGILAKNTKTKDIYQALIRAINTKNKEKLIKNGVTFIREKCSIDSIVSNEFKILKKLKDGA